MSLHIGAKPGEIAETVLITGDPLRARYVAQTMLTDLICYNEIRGMMGYTGYFGGKRVSVQGTGMGIPSTAIYIHELIHDYGVKKLIRIGTCGGLQKNLPLRQIVLAEGAYSDSMTQLTYLGSMELASVASPEMLKNARECSAHHSIPVISGYVFSTDTFYSEKPDRWNSWSAKGILGVEMETSILYALAAKKNVQALSILSVSDNILTGETTTALEREQAGAGMMKLALELA